LEIGSFGRASRFWIEIDGITCLICDNHSNITSRLRANKGRTIKRSRTIEPK
jgi:hypothetical protein